MKFNKLKSRFHFHKLDNHMMLTIYCKEIKKYRINSLILILCLFTCGFSAFASVRKYKKEADGVTFVLDKGVMKIRICRADIIQVRYSVKKDLPPFNSLVVDNQFKEPVNFKVNEGDQFIVINTGKILIKVERSSNAIAYFNLDGKLITREDKSENKLMTPQVVAGIYTYNCSTQFV